MHFLFYGDCFLKKMFGISPMKVRPGYAKFDVQNPPLNLSLNAGRISGKGTLSHLGLQVASTDDVTWGRLVSTGSWVVRWRAEPRARKTGKNIRANDAPLALAA